MKVNNHQGEATRNFIFIFKISLRQRTVVGEEKAS